MIYKCGGIRRVQCLYCGHYFDFCSFSPNENSVCPECEKYFINFHIGKERGLIKEVPEWYGKPIPKHLEVAWLGGYAVIPEHYIDVNMHIEKEKGKEITREESIAFFTKHAEREFNKPLKIISDYEWEKIRVVKIGIVSEMFIGCFS